MMLLFACKRIAQDLALLQISDSPRFPPVKSTLFNSAYFIGAITESFKKLSPVFLCQTHSFAFNL